MQSTHYIMESQWPLPPSPSCSLSSTTQASPSPPLRHIYIVGHLDLYTHWHSHTPILCTIAQNTGPHSVLLALLHGQTKTLPTPLAPVRHLKDEPGTPRGQRDPRVPPGQKKHLPTHHSISWRIAGTTKVKPMSWLPNIVASVTSPSTDGHVLVSLYY